MANLGLMTFLLLVAIQHQDRDALNALMAAARDPQLSIPDRTAAIRDLRTHAQNREEAARLLRELAMNKAEPEPVRRRAAQSLGWIIGNPRSRQYGSTRETLTEVYGQDPSPSVRAMALKALHFATHDPANKDIRAWMLGIAQDRASSAEVRVGALWALASASTYDEVTPALRTLVEASDESPQVRAQALRSLHLFMNRRECWSPALAIALDPGLDVDLRETATLFLWTAKSREKSVEEGLRRLAGDPSDRIRKAALMALDESLSHRQEILRAFRFRNDYILRRPIDVLEYE